MDEAGGGDRSALVVQRLLRGGLAASLVVVAAGFGWALVEGERTSMPVRLGHLFTDGSGADRLVAAGLLILALTPVARVIVLIVAWWHARDWRFVLVAFAVLIVLSASIALGHA